MKQSGHAIQFIIKNPITNLYQTTPQSAQFIRKLPSSFCIISVAGLYRTGKSYLLNHIILNKRNGFNVGPSINPCTKGLMIWNEVLNYDGKDVVVIDTEGLGALDEEQNHDVKVFSLAVLLSTTFVYNSVGNIDQNALQTLGLVLNLIDNIDQQAISIKPSFLWVVRDFSLQLVNEKGISINPKQYLQMALNSQGMKDSKKCQIRRTITQAFTERECFTLIKPLIDQTKLQNLSLIPLQQLRPQFVSQCLILKKLIFSSLQPIHLNSTPLSGSQYIIMVQKYLQAINNGKVPNVGDTWGFIRDERGRKVVEEIEMDYEHKIKVKLMARMPVKFGVLEELYNGVKEDMLKRFKAQTYQNSSTDDLQDLLAHIKYQLKSTNQDQMKNLLKSILTKQFQPFSKKMYSDYYDSVQSLYTDLQKNYKQMLVTNYSDKVQGLNASISSFLEKKLVDAWKFFSTKMKLEIKRLGQNQVQIQSQYKSQLTQLKNSSMKYQDELKLKISELDLKLIQSSRINQQLQQSLQQQSHKNTLQKSQTSTLYQSLLTNQTQLQQTLHQISVQKSHLQKQLLLLHAQSDKSHALLTQKNQYVSQKLIQQQKRYEDMKQLMDDRIQTFQKEKRKLWVATQDRIKEVMHENQEKREKIVEMEIYIKEIQQQFANKEEYYIDIQQKLIQERDGVKQTIKKDLLNKKQYHHNQLLEIQDQNNQLKQQINQIMLSRSQFELKNKQLVQQMMYTKSSSQKQIALHLQKLSFQQIQLKQLKSSLQQTKRSYQSLLISIQSSNNSNSTQYITKIQTLTISYQSTIKQLQKQSQMKLHELKKQLQSTKSISQDLQIEHSLLKKRYQSKEKQFNQAYKKLEQMYYTLDQKHGQTQKGYYQMNNEKEQYFTKRIKQLQTEIQQIKDRSITELQDTQRSSEQALAILKNYTEIERTQWEKRLQDQKQKSNKKQQSLKDQFQKKLHEEKQVLQEQNQMLQQKIDQMQKFFNQTLQNMKYDNQIQLQKQYNQLSQQKTQLQKSNALISQQLVLTTQNLTTRLSQLQSTSQSNLLNLRQQLQTQLSTYKQSSTQHYTFLQTKYQSLKKSNKQVEQQNLLLKAELDKERYVWREKEQGYQRGVLDLEGRLADVLFTHTKTIEELTNSHNGQRNLFNREVEGLKAVRAKLEDQKSSILLEKQAVQSTLRQKLRFLQDKIKSNKNDYDDLMNKFQLTSNYLNKKILSMQKQKQQLNGKVRIQFQQQISMKQDNYKKQTKQHNDRIYRLQTQNKSLRDKVILLQVKLASQSKSTSPQQYSQIQQIKQQYLQRQEQYRKLIQKLKRDIKKQRQEKQILELSSNFQKSRMVNHTNYKERSQRDSIINGLSQYKQDAFNRSRIANDTNKINFDNNKFNLDKMDKSRLSGVSENRNVPRKGVSPFSSNHQHQQYQQQQQQQQHKYHEERYNNQGRYNR